MEGFETLQRRIREQFRNGAPTAEDQTRITLFIQSVKGINAAVLGRLEWHPVEWQPYRFLHGQYYREMEYSTLLGRATCWSSEPQVYMEAAEHSVDLWNQTEAARYLPGFFDVDERFYRYIALGHAFMSVLRFVPLIPASVDLESHPFLSALRALEEENGRQIQTQIRLLKSLDAGLDRPAREHVVAQERARFEACFRRFLQSLGEAPGTMPAKGSSDAAS